MDYKRAYALLVGSVSDAIDEIGKAILISQEVEKALQILQDGLEETEEMYVRSGE